MRALVQRVGSASVSVGGERIAEIGEGMLVLLGIGVNDGEPEADRLVEKLRKLRIFDDAEGRMNEPLGERELLCISQFTLFADTLKGNRPSFVAAADRDTAKRLYERVSDALGGLRGEFGARMQVELVNDGPVTLMIEIEPAG